jgi:hypothetical protein
MGTVAAAKLSISPGPHWASKGEWTHLSYNIRRCPHLAEAGRPILASESLTESVYLVRASSLCRPRRSMDTTVEHSAVATGRSLATGPLAPTLLKLGQSTSLYRSSSASTASTAVYTAEATSAAASITTGTSTHARGSTTTGASASSPSTLLSWPLPIGDVGPMTTIMGIWGYLQSA